MEHGFFGCFEGFGRAADLLVCSHVQQGKRGILGSFLKGFAYAWQGLAAGSRGRNFRVMVAVTIAVIVSGYFLKLTTIEWCLVSLAVGLVLGLELVNTAGEKLVDILSPQHDPRYGLVKDLLAGAVLVAAFCAAVMGVFILWPKIF